MTTYNYLNQNIDTVVKLVNMGLINRVIIRNIEIYEYMIATKDYDMISAKYNLTRRHLINIKNQMEYKIW